MAKLDSLISDLTKAIDSSNKKKTSAYDTPATVTRVDAENRTVWVHIDGGIDETPVRMTVNAEVGDNVQVRVSGGTAWIMGNATSPPTSDAKAIAVQSQLNGLTSAFVDNSRIVNSDIEGLKARNSTIEDSVVKNSEILNTHTENFVGINSEIEDVKAKNAEIENAVIANSEIIDSHIDHFEVIDGVVQNLQATDATINGKITAAEGRIGDLESDHVSTTDLEASNARIGDLEADHVSTTDLQAVNGEITNLKSTKADISVLESDYATINELHSNYAEIDLANVNNAWIEDGVIKDAAIGDAQIIGVSANKLTAGTIDASNITVTNLNADNITAGTLNGQRIGQGSLSLDKLNEAVYTEAEVDAKLNTMQQEIDGAIETFTGSTVPTLNNYPASGWTVDDRSKHVGDVYYVVNAGNQADGYCYRFTYDNTSKTYSWVLIKDSDVTAAIQRLLDAEGDIDDLQSFESTTSSWISNTDEELRSLKSRTTAVETGLGDKVSTSTFNELSQTVDENSSSITSLTTTVSNKANSSDVYTKSQTDDLLDDKADSSTVTTLSNTVNTVSQKADQNESNISNLTTTVESKADGSTVDTLSTRVSDVEQDLSGFKSTVSSTYTTTTTFNNYKSSNDAAVAGAVSDASTAKSDASSAVSTANSAKTAAENAESSAAQSASSAQAAQTAAEDVQARADAGEFDGATGPQGDTGPQGPKGDDGTSVTVSSIRYAVSTTDSQPADSAFTYTLVPTVAEGSWLWTRTTYSDGSKVYTKAKQGKTGPQGEQGDKGDTGDTGPQGPKGDDGTSYYTYIRYSANSNGSGMVVSPTSSTKYIGLYTGTSSTVPVYTAFTWSKYMGEDGDPGDPGAAGASVSEVKILYYLKNNTTAPTKPTSEITSTSTGTDVWTTAVPTYVSGYSYFTCAQTKLSNGNFYWSTPTLDQGLTTANNNAASAVSTANAAASDASSALSTANATASELATVKTTYVKTSDWTQTNEEIRGEISDVETTTKTYTDGKISQEVTDRNSAITAKADAITASVASTYTTKTEFNNLEIGGRNLVGEFNKISVGSAEYSALNTGLFIDRTTQNTKDGTPTLQKYKDNTYVGWLASGDLTVGAKQSKIITVDDTYNSIMFKLNNSKQDPSVRWDLKALNAGTYVFSFTVTAPSESGTSYGLTINGIKLEKGNKATDWSPAPEDLEAYTDTQVTAAKAEIKITTDGISTEVAKKVGSSEIISKINQSAETVKIQASKVEIDGTATFNAIKSSADAAYDAKGAASTAESNAKAAIPTDVSDLNNDSGYITSADVPTKVSELTNDSGYQTSTQVNSAITSKGYQTASQVSSAVSSGISNASVSDLSDGSNYSTTTQMNSAISTATSDMATNTSVANTYAAKTAAVKRTQRIYYQSNSTTAPGTPGTASSNWVTDNTGNAGTWTKKRMSYSSTNKYIWTCEQSETVSGTVSYTTVLLDDSTTVIDGGNIITGTVTANALNASDINASNSLTVGALTTDSQSQVLNSNIQVGGKNLLRNTKTLTLMTDAVDGYLQTVNTTRGTISGTYKGASIIHVDDTSASSSYVACLQWKNIYAKFGSTYTVSFWAKADTTGTNKFAVYFHGDSGYTQIAKTVTSQGDTNTNINGLAYISLTSDWERYWVTWTLKDTGDESIGKAVLFRLWYGADVYIAGSKLETGNTATDWESAPEDVDYDINTAAKTATNYLIADSTGIMIADLEGSTETPSTATSRNVFIDSDSVDIRDGTDVLASFGENVTIGNPENSSYINIDSSSMKIYDNNNVLAFNISAAVDSVTEQVSETDTFLGHQSVVPSGMSLTMLETRLSALDLSAGSLNIRVYKNHSLLHEFSISAIGTYTNGSLTATLTSDRLLTVIYTNSTSEYESFTWSRSYDYYATYNPPTYLLGNTAETIGGYATSIGKNTKASGVASLATGEKSEASGNNSFATGYKSVASGGCSHAEGDRSLASGLNAHAEGGGTAGNLFVSGPITVASGDASHAEGCSTTASGYYSHSEGYNTKASNYASHAEGTSTKAFGDSSHAQNLGTIASMDAQTAIGTYNTQDSAPSTAVHPDGDTSKGNYAFIIGNGTSDSARSNALTVDWQGNIVASGGISVNDSVIINGRTYGSNEVLWTHPSGDSNGYYMSASHTATLTKNVSTQPNGIVLVWSSYTNSSANNYDWLYYFIPKWHVTTHSGTGITIPICLASTNGNGSSWGAKYVYVYNNKITGYAGNNQGNAASFVLRAVIGV